MYMQASRLGIAGGSFGRPKSLQQSTLATCSAVTASAQDEKSTTATVRVYAVFGLALTIAFSMMNWFTAIMKLSHALCCMPYRCRHSNGL